VKLTVSDVLALVSAAHTRGERPDLRARDLIGMGCYRPDKRQPARHA